MKFDVLFAKSEKNPIPSFFRKKITLDFSLFFLQGNSLSIYIIFMILYLTLRARYKRPRKKPVAAENRIAPRSPSSIGSKIPASKTWQGSLCSTSQKSKNSFPNQNSFSKSKKFPKILLILLRVYSKKNLTNKWFF